MVISFFKKNQASGVAVAPECLSVYTDIKLARKHRFVMYKINDKKDTIIVENIAEPKLTYADFLKGLPKV